MTLFGRDAIARLQRELRVERERRERAEEVLEVVSEVLRRVAPGVVVTDVDGSPLLRSAPPVEGHAEVLVHEALAAVQARATAGEEAEREVELTGPPRRSLIVRGLTLPNGRTAAVVDDRSERARLDSVRTDFVTNISHELKTPVAALAVLAEAMAGSDDPAIHRHLAGKMIDEAHRVSSTIDDLLELSRIELGGSGAREELALASLLGEVAARVRFGAETAGVRLDIATAEDGIVVGDRLQLVSALANLVDNAVKYSERGSTVKVTAQFEDGWLEIEVVDEGVGIPARDLDRIFERFYRVDRARSRATGGTGLGLAIVRHVAANHGGEVTVRSREGEGSTFTLRIPGAGSR